MHTFLEKWQREKNKEDYSTFALRKSQNVNDMSTLDSEF